MILSFSGAATAHLCLLLLLAHAHPSPPYLSMTRNSPRVHSPLSQSGRSSPRNLSPLSQPPRSPRPDGSTSAGSAGKKNRPKKADCPCQGSSDGKDWVYKCTECNQHWHGSCANLKGTRTLNQVQVNKINSEWTCPWCWTCPYAKPGTHVSILNESSLLEKTLSCATLQKVSDTVAEAIKNTVPLIDLTTIQSKLDTLSSELQAFKDSHQTHLHPKSTSMAPHLSANIPLETENKRRVLEPPEPPFKKYQEGYLTNQELEDIGDLLGYCRDGGDFVDEKGHKVLLFGEPYSYRGSKFENPDPIPDELKAIIDRMTSDLSLNHKPNSVLVNLFPANNRMDKNDTYLSMHSDDEATIMPGSDIITISLGGPRKVAFEGKHSEHHSELKTTSNSLYIMSKSSQSWYRHGIPPPQSGEEVEERMSITFRSLSSQSSKSILLIGDSNTKEINFGVGSGKVGASYPGRRVKAARVQDIVPEECVGYQNIFIHCGTNDLRCKYVTGGAYIHQVVETLKEKLLVIEQLCPMANIFVVPVLPTRIPAMNDHIQYYNVVVNRMLYQQFPKISFSSVHSFLDRQGLLDIRLTRNNDTIHLGKKGIAMYVSMMKSCVFKKLKSSKPPLETGDTSGPPVDPRPP